MYRPLGLQKRSLITFSERSAKKTPECVSTTVARLHVPDPPDNSPHLILTLILTSSCLERAIKGTRSRPGNYLRPPNQALTPARFAQLASARTQVDVPTFSTDQPLFEAKSGSNLRIRFYLSLQDNKLTRPTSSGFNLLRWSAGTPPTASNEKKPGRTTTRTYS